MVGVHHALTNFTSAPTGLGLHLDLSLGGWAADGLLAIFFFVVGLEPARVVAGDLRGPRRAAPLPIAAAVGGIAARGHLRRVHPQRR